VSHGSLLHFASGLSISRSVTVPDSDEQPGGYSGLNTNIKVGIIAAVVGISVGLLGALGFYLRRRRNNRAGTLRRSKNEEDGAGAPDGEFVSMFLHD